MSIKKVLVSDRVKRSDMGETRSRATAPLDNPFFFFHGKLVAVVGRSSLELDPNKQLITEQNW